MNENCRQLLFRIFCCHCNPQIAISARFGPGSKTDALRDDMENAAVCVYATEDALVYKCVLWYILAISHKNALALSKLL